MPVPVQSPDLDHIEDGQADMEYRARSRAKKRALKQLLANAIDSQTTQPRKAHRIEPLGRSARVQHVRKSTGPVDCPANRFGSLWAKDDIIDVPSREYLARGRRIPGEKQDHVMDAAIVAVIATRDRAMGRACENGGRDVERNGKIANWQRVELFHLRSRYAGIRRIHGLH